MGAMAGEAVDVVVDSAEEVGRLCFSAAIPITIDEKHPNHVDPTTGLLRLEELTWTELRKRGFSVQRLSMYTIQDARRELRRRETKWSEKGKNPKFQLAGVLVAKVAAINAIHDAKKGQVFKVLPKPTSSSAGHAEVYIGPTCTREDLLKHRVALQSALGPLKPCTVLNGANLWTDLWGRSRVILSRLFSWLESRV